jgi:hypothetical protein
MNMLATRTPDDVLPASEVPPDWVTWLRRECKIYLVKHGRYAEVAYRWIPPKPGHVSGVLAIRDNHRINEWFMGVDGTGFDGSQLILPVKGHMPTLAQSELAEEDRQLLVMLLERVQKLEQAVLTLNLSQLGN